ncbi:FlhC family transcriptional regulator [Azospirillum endophyticum]
MVNKCEQHRKLALAIRLIRRNLRTSIVAVHTNLSATQLRTLYHEIHGHASVSGMFPESDRLFATHQRALEASIILTAYLNCAGTDALRRIDIEALLRAHDFYIDVRRECAGLNQQAIDLTMAWILARDLRSCVVELRTCPCGIRFAVHEQQRIQVHCPVCGLPPLSAAGSPAHLSPLPASADAGSLGDRC